MPDYFNGLSHVEIQNRSNIAINKINPLATKTTTGCVRKCKFCLVPKTEGKFQELDDWEDKPILIDNNLLASSRKHFDRVIDRLIKWGWADFNQGLDARLLTDYHAKRIAEIKKRTIMRILIIMKEGLIESVQKLEEENDGMVNVEIRDYDADTVEEEDLLYDAGGIPYIERHNERYYE